MRYSIFIIVLFLFESCKDNSTRNIQYSKGDFWVADFTNNNFSAKAFANNKIYCSSSVSNVDTTSNYFYCLNLKSGRVDWAIPVKSWAFQAPIICDSFIYYCSYVGDIYKFDKNGNRVWYTQFPTTYGGHSINPINNNLILSTVAYGLREIDCKTGNIIDSIGYGKMDVPFPIFKNDTIFQAINDSLFCQSFTAKSIFWKRRIGANVKKLFLDRHLLFYFDNSQSLYCLNSLTGELLWQSDPIFQSNHLNHIWNFTKEKSLVTFQI